MRHLRFMTGRVLPSAICLTTLLLGLTAQAEELPPKATPGDLVTDYQGIKVADPYRALEDLQSPQTQRWATGQGAYTRSRLDRLPGLKHLREQIDALDADQSPVVSSLKVTPRGQWFYLKRMPGESYTKLYMRASVSAPEKLLLDPEAWKQQTGELKAINNFTVSPDGKHVAAVISKADAELGELQIIAVATGQQVVPALPAIWGEIPGVWTRDGQAVQYSRGADALKPGGSPYGKMQQYELRLDGSGERLLFGWNVGFGMTTTEKDWLSTLPAASETYTVAGLYGGVSSDVRLHVARTADLAKDPAKATWTPVIGEEAAGREFGVWRHYVYVRTYLDAPRYRIVRYDLDHPGQPPVTVVPQPRGVLDEMAVASDGLYYTVRTGSVRELFRIPHGKAPAAAVRIKLPYEGADELFEADPDVPGVNFLFQGWTRPQQILHAEGKVAKRVDLIPTSASKVGQDWVAEETTCKSHDGVAVPMSVIYRRGLVKDGSHPTLIDGYGGYGMTEPAVFIRKLDPLLQRGGIYVDVKPRGGGAYGREWYQAGVGPRKFNTWKDMIACGETLIARGYTSKGKLAIQGTSMGGVAVGRAITERPDLFAAAIVRVGLTEAIRMIEISPNGPNHEEEMGSLKTAEGVKQLLAMSTYHQIQAGEKYPATLFTVGMNDNRVDPWITFKTFARLEAASGSGKPVLMRVEAEGGHGMSTTAAQRNAELADRLAFVLWQTGDPAFQPAAGQ